MLILIMWQAESIVRAIGQAIEQALMFRPARFALGPLMANVFLLFVLSLLFVLGFSAKGVLAGKYVATFQSKLGNVVAGSCFSIVQETPMQGPRGLCRPFLSIILSFVGGVGAIIWTAQY